MFMPIALDTKDEALETALEALGKKQPHGTLLKTAMLRAVAWAAVRSCERSDDPLAWMSPTQSASTDGNPD